MLREPPGARPELLLPGDAQWGCRSQGLGVGRGVLPVPLVAVV
jgi:hypothetical protein